MTSKERVFTALSGGVPDRIPVLPQICPPHAISVSGRPLNETIVDHLRHSEKYDLMVSECAAAYGVDGFRVWLGGEDFALDWNGKDHYARSPRTGEPFSLIDFSGGGGLLRLPEDHRELNRIDIDSIILPDESKLSESRELEPLKKCAARYGHDMFIIGVPGQFTIETLAHYQGMEQTLIDIIERPDFVKDITEKQLLRSISYAKAMLDAGADGLYIGETFGQFMSPEQFKELC
ncbi:MAG: hypothetical protein HN368_13670, partial [Spirochaetales bacterium]|nr:hypothetical protein [Spirochaetales bacterium]